VQRDLRDLVRYRQHLVEERTRTANRLQKVLEDANLKLTSVASDIQGTSAQAILRAMLAGNEDPEQLANLARGQLRLKRQALVAALEGRMRPHHRFMLAQVLGHLDVLEQEIAALEAEIEARLTEMPAFAEAVERLDTIPGVSRQAALIIVAEIGVDMSRFPSDRHLTSWAGMAPGNNESGGKKRVAKTPKGNRYLRRTLVQAAWAAARTRNTYLRAMYHRLAARRGKHRAAVAVGRTILQIAYHLIQREEVYHDLGDDYFDRLDRERTVKRLTQRLETLGYEVHPKEGSLPPAA
jgi:transposase